jgi:hypothetical protein
MYVYMHVKKKHTYTYRWRLALPHDELDAENATSDFLGRALTSKPRTRPRGERNATSLASTRNLGDPENQNRIPGIDGLSLNTGQNNVMAVTQNASAAGQNQEFQKVVWQLHMTESPEMPPPRSGHAMAVWRNAVYMYGGLADVMGKRLYMDDMWILDTRTIEWMRLEQVCYGGGQMPSERAGMYLGCKIMCICAICVCIYVYG